MSSSATNTQGQFAVAELAQSLDAGLVEADIYPLEARRPIGGFDALPAPWTAMRTGASLVNCGNFLQLFFGGRGNTAKPSNRY